MEEPLRSLDDDRPTAEEMLARIRMDEGEGWGRGRHRIYLGMAPGVGKTMAMLAEAHRRREQGTDIVVGLVETHGRRQTLAAIGDLEVIPRARIEYKGVRLEELDADAVLRRRPQVALVDELAHTNAPGSPREKRWQDVEVLLNHGITVFSTVNVQHLESLADIVESITGIAIRERIPDHVIDAADEVQLVDLSPQALRQRLRQGVVYPSSRATQALDEFFREGNLNALRELALRKVSSTVHEDLEAYMRDHRIEASWAAGERVLVCVDAQPRTQHLIRRAWRQADRRHADLLAVFVETPAWARSGPEERRVLEENLRFAEDLGATVLRVAGQDVAKALAQLASDKNISSIVVGHSRHGRLHEFLRGSIASNLLRLVRGVDVHVVAEAPKPDP
jgi:two-component system, OmpR family, sensor histidine kinase KdpD